MASTVSNIIEATALNVTDDTVYTSENVKTIIDKFTIFNGSSSTPTSFSVHIVPEGGTAGPTNLIVKDKTIFPGRTDTGFEIVGHVLNFGDFIAVSASNSPALILRASGRLVSN